MGEGYRQYLKHLVADPKANPSAAPGWAAIKGPNRKALGLLVVSAAAYAICVFLVVSKTTTQWDQSTFILLNDFAPDSAFLNTLMISFSQYGREVVWTLLTIVLVFSQKQGHRRTAFYLLVALLATIVPGYGSQYGVNRLRPDLVIPNAHELVQPLAAPSFPSGHALVVFAGVVIIAFTWKNRKALVLLTFDAAMVSFARIYVGAHFPMDTIAGILLGIAIGSAVMVFQHKLDGLFLRFDRKWKLKVVDRIRKEKKNETPSMSLGDAGSPSQ